MRATVSTELYNSSRTKKKEEQRGIEMEFIRVQSLITIVSHFVFIVLSFWAVQSIRTDYSFKKNHPQQIKLFYLLISLALGYTASNFFLDFFMHTQNLLLFLN